MIRVYHAKNPTFSASKNVKLSDLHLVAEVDTDSLDQAYMLTNTIDNPWWENDGVKFLGSPDHGMDGCRSSSVGDVFERNGTWHAVDNFGFTPAVVS